MSEERVDGMKKKIILSVIAVLLVAVGIVTKVYWSEILSILPKIPAPTENEQITLIAHRGFSSVAPENTLASIKEAGKASFYGAEFDIRLTSDGKWVVFHDDSVKHMTDSKGYITQMTADEVSKLNIDNGYGIKEYPDEKVPTLEEALNECKEADVIPVIEIKLNKDQKPDYENLAQIISSADCDEVMVISFNREALTGLKKYLPDARYWLVISDVTDEAISFCTENGIDGLDFNGNKLKNYDYIEKINEAGLECGAWTIDIREVAKILSDKGVRYITTNTIYRAE